MSHILHIVNKSPMERSSFASCFRIARAGDSVLMIEDGVYAALANTTLADKITRRMNELSFYALGPDIAARGLGDTALIENLGIVDYEGFVDLVTASDITQSWL